MIYIIFLNTYRAGFWLVLSSFFLDLALPRFHINALNGANSKIDKLILIIISPSAKVTHGTGVQIKLAAKNTYVSIIVANTPAIKGASHQER